MASFKKINFLLNPVKGVCALFSLIKKEWTDRRLGSFFVHSPGMENFVPLKKLYYTWTGRELGRV